MLRVLAALLALLVALPAAAQQRVTVSSQLPADKPQSLFWVRFAEIVAAERPDAYAFNIVTSGALGGEKEEAEGVRLGAIAGALSTAANLTTWVPGGTVLDLPFLFTGRDHIARALSGPLGDDLLARYRAAGFEAPAFVVFGARDLISDRPLETPADLAGLTIRSLQSDLHLAFWRFLGASPTALPITEAYTALANGVVDAMDFTKSGYEGLRIDEVAPVVTETEHMWAIGVVYFDPNFWAALPAADRALFARAARQSAAYFDALTREDNAAAMARTVARGATLVPADQERWSEATAPFVDAYVAGLADPDVARMVELVRAAR